MPRTAATWGGPRVHWIEAVGPAGVVLGVGFLTLVALVSGNGNVALACAPALGVLAIWGMTKAPVRNTLLVLFFLGLSLDRPGDADDLWMSPFRFLGGLLMFNVNSSFPDVPIKLSGLWLILLLLLVLRIHRLLKGRVLDVPGAVPPAPPMTWALLASTITVIWLVALGLATGGDPQMAKIQVQVILAVYLVAYLLMPSLRVTRDYRALGTVIVTAACIKAVMALYIRQVLPAAVMTHSGRLQEVDYVTSHGDSLLFSSGLIILIVAMVFQPSRKHLRTLLGLGTLIVAGMLANDRRIAWAELGLGVVVVLAMSTKSWTSRRLLRTVTLASPVLAVYLVVGWFLPSKIFAPVQTIRSMVSSERTDGSVDKSTLFRDIENFQLVDTFKKHSLLGLGFGQPFETVFFNDLPGFKDYHYLPHNSMLGLMAFAGVIGFIGLLFPSVVAIFLAARALQHAGNPEVAMAAAAAMANIAAYFMHLWGDIGFTEMHSIFTVGAALAVASQVAMSTGTCRIAPMGFALSLPVRESR